MSGFLNTLLSLLLKAFMWVCILYDLKFLKLSFEYYILYIIFIIIIIVIYNAGGKSQKSFIHFFYKLFSKKSNEIDYFHVTLWYKKT